MLFGVIFRYETGENTIAKKNGLQPQIRKAMEIDDILKDAYKNIAENTDYSLREKICYDNTDKEQAAKLCKL